MCLFKIQIGIWSKVQVIETPHTTVKLNLQSNVDHLELISNTAFKAKNANNKLQKSAYRAS